MLGSVIGSAITAVGNYASAQSAQRANEKAMKHRHQWEVADLEAAGLNPILSAHGAGTAGLPGVASQMPDLGQSSAVSNKAELEKAQAKNVEAQTRLTNAQANIVENTAEKGSEFISKGLDAISSAADAAGKINVEPLPLWKPSPQSAKMAKEATDANKDTVLKRIINWLLDDFTSKSNVSKKYTGKIIRTR